MNLVDNELRIYFGDDLRINDYITLHHPKLDDVISMGENEYFSTVYTLSAIPSDMKCQLWDMGICWEDISDFEFFSMISRSLPIEKTKVFFGNLDFQKFQLGMNKNTEELVMYQIDDEKEEVIILDNFAYLNIVEAIRKIHGIKPKVEHAASKIVRDILLAEDRKKLQKLKDTPHESQLLPLVSSLINCSEFKYGLNEVRSMPMYAFMDSVMRVQVIKSTTALLNGCYSGMIDTSKINKKELNWMRDLRKGN